MKKNMKRLRSDRGDSELVSLLIVLPLVLGILFTIIDTSIYFSNRAVVQTAVRDSARTVAIMGGNGTNSQATPIEKKYGTTIATACAGLSTDPRVKNAYRVGVSTVIECQALQSYKADTSLINVTINSLTCTPVVARGVGAKTSCTVTWKYGSIPGSALGFIQVSENNTTVGSSEAEVDYTGGNPLVPDSSILVPR